MKNEIDYTKMRKGSKPDGRRVIAICPKCGRKGLQTKYSKGGSYNHKAKWLLFGLTITDHCYIKEADWEPTFAALKSPQTMEVN